MFRRLLRAAAASAVVLGAVTGSAVADVSPASTSITMTSTNLNMQMFGFMSETFNAGLAFTTPAAGSGPAGLAGDTTATPRLSGCNLATHQTGSGWTIELAPTGSTSNTLTIRIPGGGAAAGGWGQSGWICGVSDVGAATLVASYTDGATAVTFNPQSVPFTTQFCGPGTRSLTGTFTLSQGLTVS